MAEVAWGVRLQVRVLGVQEVRVCWEVHLGVKIWVPGIQEVQERECRGARGRERGREGAAGLLGSMAK